MATTWSDFNILKLHVITFNSPFNTENTMKEKTQYKTNVLLSLNNFMFMHIPVILLIKNFCSYLNE